MIARKIREDDTQIYAYYVAVDAIDSRIIKEQLQAVLPSYMIPAYLMQLDNIPVNQNGKVDESKLPEVKEQLSKDYVAPRNRKEQQIAEVFEDVLGIQSVGIYHNFFELGGDSIKAIRVVSKLREFGYELSVKELMKSGTVEELSSKLQVVRETQCDQNEITGEVPLLPIQHEFEL